MKFLVGYNGSEVGKAALTLARKFAKVFDASVYVMTSMEGGAGERVAEIEKVTNDLDFAKKFLEEENVPCEIQQLARGMTPAEDLVKFARENDVDQIFVGVEKKSRTRKIILGSTAQFVILRAHCPVITVK